MGEVYRAVDSRLGRAVAIKILTSDLAKSPEARLRFEQEMRAIAAISHPNILSIFDVGTTDEDIPFSVTELLEGISLRKKIREKPLSWEETVEIVTDVAGGLSAAHELGIVHRDLKPENVFLTKAGVVKILDFGLASLIPEVAPIDDSTPTSPLPVATTSNAGTVGYMAPEMLRGEHATAAADIFSLGCIAFECLTGKHPFRRGTAFETIASVLEHDPPRVLPLRPGLPAGVDEFLRRCLEKEPSDRIDSTERLVEAMGDVGKSARSEGKTASRAFERIAVLPFEVEPDTGELLVLGDGLTEGLIDALSQSAVLRVKARSTVMRHRDSGETPEEIGRQLEVDAVVTGRVSVRGNHLDVRAELVDVRDGTQIWGEGWRRASGDLVAVQNELAHVIADALELRLTGEERKRISRRHATSNEAYRAYLEGRHYWNKRSSTVEEFRRAMDAFNRAIELDPLYAVAYSGIADCYNVLGNFTMYAPKDAYPKAKAAAERALDIDAEIAEAHVSLAWTTMFYDWNFEEADRSFRRAIELNSSYAVAHQWFAALHSARGDHDKAVFEARLALEKDPLLIPANMMLGWMFYEARRWDEALEQARKTIDLAAGFMAAEYFLAWSLFQLGRRREALDQFRDSMKRSSSNARIRGGLGYVLGRQGQRAEARQILDELVAASSLRYVPSYEIAMVHLGMGEVDEALSGLERALEERSGWLLWLEHDAVFDELRDETRFRELLKRMEEEKQG